MLIWVEHEKGFITSRPDVWNSLMHNSAEHDVILVSCSWILKRQQLLAFKHFMNMINTTSGSFKAWNIFIFSAFIFFYEEVKFGAQLSLECRKVYNRVVQRQGFSRRCICENVLICRNSIINP